ncbi:hypothetical protein ACFUEN_29205 [Streptomyces griseorubiginosus]|uniref:hypothetical protein n=1 Tax=Streptomyces griseorubiginosus TaxID=67304 RepID=UPI00364588A1
MYPDYDTPRLTGPYRDVHTERASQQEQFGSEEHTLQEWALALAENVGTLAEAVLDATRDDSPDASLTAVRREAVKTGAGVIALLEYVDSLEQPTTT